MADRNHNTEAIQQTVAGRAQERDVMSLPRPDSRITARTLRDGHATLGDGHTLLPYFRACPPGGPPCLGS